MRIFSLTKLGVKAALRGEGPIDEVKVLQYIRENRTATEDELSVIAGDGYLTRKLKREGLVEELTK